MHRKAGAGHVLAFPEALLRSLCTGVTERALAYQGKDHQSCCKGEALHGCDLSQAPVKEVPVTLHYFRKALCYILAARHRPCECLYSKILEVLLPFSLLR